MEKKSPLPFIILMTLGFVGLIVIQSKFFPPKIPEAGVDNSAPKQVDEKSDAEKKGDEAKPEKQPEDADAKPKHPDLPRTFPSIGTHGKEGTPLVLTLDSKGATLRRVEVNDRRKNGKLKYRDIDYRKAWIGHLELESVAKLEEQAAKPDPPKEGEKQTEQPVKKSGKSGCIVRVVPKGTPADLAGLKIGDVILSVSGIPVTGPDDFAIELAKLKPGENVALEITSGATKKTVQVESDWMPVQIISPSPPEMLTPANEKRKSFQLTLMKQQPGIWEDVEERMRFANWASEIKSIGGKQVVEFSFDLPGLEDDRHLQVLKRFWIPNADERDFNVKMEFEFRNLGKEETSINYELCGPTALPLEGWWYQQKIHGNTWAIGKMAGARDITLSTAHRPFYFTSGPQIVSDKKGAKLTSILHMGSPSEQRQLNHIGVDTQYFNVALHPEREDFTVFSGFALPASVLDENKSRRRRMTDVSFVLFSEPIKLKPWDESKPATAYKETFNIFAGPKEPSVLKKAGMEDIRTFGWFAMFSKPLIWLLHVLYKLTFSWSYGLAIVLLTLIVRLCMVPISRKAALNAQMMQHLQPEMKKIKERYKDDMQRQGIAQRELFSKYKYNPFGGCMLMFLQLPVFLGLYRGLSVDVALRDAPLIPGLGWCSNLSAPDQLFSWSSWMPAFLGGETGFLGPYFNILPILAIVFMLVQQKLFMPPATDDQSAMAQKMMKFMMLFMGFIFFKVAAGLCIYFITSSIWGIIERKMLPKPELDTTKFDGLGDGKGGSKQVEAIPLRNEKELEERRKRDKERKRKLRDRK